MIEVLIAILITLTMIPIFYRLTSNIKRKNKDLEKILNERIQIFDKNQKEYENNNQSINSTLNEIKKQKKEQDQIIDLNMKSNLMLNNKLIDEVLSLKKEIKKISEFQNKIKRKTSIDNKIEVITDTQGTQVQFIENNETGKLTVTEEQVIKLLIDKGPKTANEIRKEIKKTREHMARLMKKLWREGYVERDTHKIPFVYRASENLKKNLEEK